MNIARILDTSSNYGVGGLNFGSIYQNFNGIILRFGVGAGKDKIFNATMGELVRSGFPFQTFMIFGRPKLCGMSIREQVFRWLDAPGVLLGRAMVDVEPAIYGYDETMVSSDELAEATELLDGNHPLPWSWYSNKKYVNLLSWPRFLCGHDLLAAQYPWEPWKFREYLDFETFLRDYGSKLISPWVKGTNYQGCAYAWQFTAHGRTPDVSQVVDGWSKKDHDFSVSTIERDDFMVKFWPGSVPPPSEVEMTFIVQTANLAVRPGPDDDDVKYPVIRRMTAGTTFKAVDVFAPSTGGEVWAKNADGEFACITMGYNQHMRSA